MRSRMLRWWPAVALAWLMPACAPPAGGGGGPAASPLPSPLPPVSPTLPPGGLPTLPPLGTPAPPTAAEVQVTDAGFVPERLEIARGTTVTWRFGGLANHSVSTLDGFDSQIRSPGESFGRTFTDPGRFRYFCEVHPQHVGEIVVLP